MSAAPRPTDAEKADAVMRLMDEFDAAHAALGRARTVLRERCERGQSLSSGPLFPFIGEKLSNRIDNAREQLWAARDVAARQYLDAVRADGAS